MPLKDSRSINNNNNKNKSNQATGLICKGHSVKNGPYIVVTRLRVLRVAVGHRKVSRRRASLTASRSPLGLWLRVPGRRGSPGKQLADGGLGAVAVAVVHEQEAGLVQEGAVAAAAAAAARGRLLGAGKGGREAGGKSDYKRSSRIRLIHVGHVS